MFQRVQCCFVKLLTFISIRLFILAALFNQPPQESKRKLVRTIRDFKKNNQFCSSGTRDFFWEKTDIKNITIFAWKWPKPKEPGRFFQFE